MAIPAGPFPTPIDPTDVRPGMHLRFTGSYADGRGYYQADGSVLYVNPSTIAASIGADGSVILTLPLEAGAFGFASETFELMEEYTGDPNEPPANSAVLGADGTVYQRAADPADPTNSVWYPVNSTTATDWAMITAAGTPTILLDGSTL